MIELREVAKEYGGLGRGRVAALDGISLAIPAGTAWGIVGPNGAGKSTLLRLLLGYLRPSRGEVTIDGLPPRAYVEAWGIGYVPERIDLPPRWTVREAMLAFAALSELEHPRERVDAALRQMGIVALAPRRLRTLSKGNLGRLALAQALFAPRKLLVLDEPTDGLDPEWTARLREILREWRREDPERVLLISSHNLDEVERTADRVAVLNEGRLREVVELRAPATRAVYRLEIEPETRALTALHEAFPGAEPAGAPGAFRVVAGELAELNRRLAALLAAGATVRAFAPEGAALEERFRRSLAGAREGR